MKCQFCHQDTDFDLALCASCEKLLWDAGEEARQDT